MEKRIAVIVATWFGSGLVPPIFLRGMAGTYGSLAALPVSYVLLYNAHGYILTTLIVFTLGFWCIPIAEEELGPRTDWRGKTKTRDQNQIVIDEVLGTLVAYSPLLFMPRNLLNMAAPFLLFRLFDIVKIFPAGYFDSRKSPAAIMFDDVVAGVYAAILISIIFFIL
ncbi:hypothetical protein A3B18_00780 [Candidatus Giovannonibacteria bacterium RIFCSPLOWO2_01_FULL_46_13]|uniref:YutG/PgpA domain-containing protein n=1 Tax=Candidatus Giovannonibacteria bacterium RIFCSPLOWO2_01_FULL_46_13 TaxID=1798352 RepID=A0A1F5X3M8_9BACT|nr:MAG: hypothetical protein A3B18_00780 [Candidatus Giovannonibacteria bacterium RIFCSPLOWO2_01_FULL_46_13]